MIGGLLFLIASLIISLATTFMNALAFAIPQGVIESINWLFVYTRILDGIFPVSTLLTATLAILEALLIKYSIVVILWALNFIPGIKVKTLPKLRS